MPPDQPSPESAKLAESMAILEFLADIFPDAPLLPVDPLLRAKARTFTEIFRNYVSDEFRGAFFLGKPVAGVLQALEKLQAALPQTGFAAGEWSIAEAAVAPFITRLFLFVRVGLGSYTEENWQMLRDALEGERFARIKQYVQDIHERPSFKKTWGDDVSAEEFCLWWMWLTTRLLRRPGKWNFGRTTRGSAAELSRLPSRRCKGGLLFSVRVLEVFHLDSIHTFICRSSVVSFAVHV